MVWENFVAKQLPRIDAARWRSFLLALVQTHIPPLHSSETETEAATTTPGMRGGYLPPKSLAITNTKLRGIFINSLFNVIYFFNTISNYFITISNLTYKLLIRNSLGSFSGIIRHFSTFKGQMFLERKVRHQ